VIPRSLLTPADVRSLLDRHGIRPSRALGQNFVADPNTVRRIARLAGVGAGDRVVEIGPGIGSLTLALLETGAAVTAVELDRHLLPVLDETVVPGGAVVIHADATTLDWAATLGHEGGWVLVANLPYNVATSLVLDVLEDAPMVERLLVMVQREVGERLAAGPGTKIYGAVSVKVAWFATARVVARVPSTVFVPQPKVESVLVELARHPSPPADPGPGGRERLFRMVDAGFATRRKMLRNTLAGLVADEAFSATGVEPTERAEQLGLDAWAKLAAWSSPPPS